MRKKRKNIKTKNKTKNNKEEFSIDEMEKAQKELVRHYFKLIEDMLLKDLENFDLENFYDHPEQKKEVKGKGR